MNRRGFISALCATAAGFAIDEEKLLWKRGVKLISIPARSRNVFITPEAYAGECLKAFNRNLLIAQSFGGKAFIPEEIPIRWHALNIRRPLHGANFR